MQRSIDRRPGYNNGISSFQEYVNAKTKGFIGSEMDYLRIKHSREGFKPEIMEQRTEPERMEQRPNYREDEAYLKDQTSLDQLVFGDVYNEPARIGALPESAKTSYVRINKIE